MRRLGQPGPLGHLRPRPVRRVRRRGLQRGHHDVLDLLGGDRRPAGPAADRPPARPGAASTNRARHLPTVGCRHPLRPRPPCWTDPPHRPARSAPATPAPATTCAAAPTAPAAHAPIGQRQLRLRPPTSGHASNYPRPQRGSSRIGADGVLSQLCNELMARNTSARRVWTYSRVTRDLSFDSCGGCGAGQFVVVVFARSRLMGSAGNSGC